MRLLIADTDFAYRARLRPAVKRIPGLLTAEEFDTFDALAAALERSSGQTEVLLLAHDLAGFSAERIARLTKDAPSRSVVVIGPNDPELLRHTFRNGARGYLCEGDEMRELATAVRVVAEGGVYIPPLLTLKPSEEQIPTPAGPVPAGFFREGGENYLTPRQWEVLSMVRADWDNAQIAERLGVTVGTVKIHMTAIFKALGVRNRTGAKIAAVRLGVPEMKKPA